MLPFVACAKRLRSSKIFRGQVVKLGKCVSMKNSGANFSSQAGHRCTLNGLRRRSPILHVLRAHGQLTADQALFTILGFRCIVSQRFPCKGSKQYRPKTKRGTKSSPIGTLRFKRRVAGCGMGFPVSVLGLPSLTRGRLWKLYAPLSPCCSLDRHSAGRPGHPDINGWCKRGACSCAAINEAFATVARVLDVCT